MKYLFGLIILIHGVIHILGFLKAFSLAEINSLTLYINKFQGIAWLVSGLILIAYLILYLSHNPFSWLVGVVAVIVSQLLIIYFWKDAKFGSIPNALILILAIVSYGQFSFNRLVQRETTSLINSVHISPDRSVSEDDLGKLPEPVKRWLQNSGMIGKRYIMLGKVIQRAEMKMKPEQQKWLDASAVQYTAIDLPAFIWSVDVKMNGLMFFLGRDKFEGGKGEMLIKLNALLNVVNEHGEKLNEGTIQRYLGEMVWFPSLALSEYISWEQVNDTTAKAIMQYKGTKGSGTFRFNSNGDFVSFSAMRYMGNEIESSRYEWVMLVEEYKTFDGIKVPSKMSATWKLDEGDWTWLKLEVTDIKYNENCIR
ncbi:MAG: hypothetical protein KKA81_06795 [Bacteroidetes bacterium]|nr:hypothetical protein [Bacteroidota bacterium]